MNIDTSGKMEYPSFIKVPIILKLRHDEFKEGNFLHTFAKISPLAISSYMPNEYEENGEKHSATSVVVAGHEYYVDMSMEKFDKIIDNTSRSIDINLIGND